MARKDELNNRFYDRRSAFLDRGQLLALLCAILFLAACGSDSPDRPYAQYYFPYESLEEGLVYEYESIGGDSTTSEYWFYKSIQEKGAWQLTGTYYDEYFQVRQFFREEIHTSGSLMQDYFLYQPDSSGNTTRYDAELTTANGFPFYLKDTTSVLLFELRWTFSEDPIHRLTLTRNRQYRELSKYSFQGNTLPAVIFDLRELIDDEQDGHLEQEYTGTEIYAKDIGLVYYRKEIGKEMTIEFRLKDIYPMARFEQKFKAQLN